ncbi:MAG: O-methyltransferase [Ktedonobacterales bacterium]
MTMDQWGEVDQYLAGLFVPPDPVLDAVLESAAAADLPPIHVSPNQGKLLYLLARAQHAHQVLEIGTLAAYSTIWLARGLEPGGQLITLEIDPRHAEVARANLQRAGLESTVEVRLGPALASLEQLKASGSPPFDLVFIDADKPSTPDYVTWALELTHPGSLIIVDNIVRNGAVSDPTSTDANIRGMRAALAQLAGNPQVVTTGIQTVGSKGYDGFAIALVTGDS